MSSSDIAIQARGVSKSYRIVHEQKATTIGESIVNRVRKPLHKATSETFWALKDVDFDIRKGDVVGIIGRNGAGKSTLLKILSRITAPTLGEITIRGRVGSLLEVGTGFHPELTGRENIYLNGSILGMSRREIDSRFDAIVDFSGVEQFLDTPVKRYSSGMYVRLAFAVAAHLDPEVMIVDEVLAVGDAEFQKKCLAKMQDVASSGRTVLFVSHNMHSIASLCRRALLLEKGRMAFQGDVETAIKHYLGPDENTLDISQDLNRREGTGDVRFTSVVATQTPFLPDGDKAFDFVVERFKDNPDEFSVIGIIVDELRRGVAHIHSRLNGQLIRNIPLGKYRLTFTDLGLKPGNYELILSLKAGDNHADTVDPACRFTVEGTLPYLRSDIDLQEIWTSYLAKFDLTEIR